MELVLFTTYYILDALKYSPPVDVDALLEKQEVSNDVLIEVNEKEIAEEVELLSEFQERKKEKLTSYGSFL